MDKDKFVKLFGTLVVAVVLLLYICMSINKEPDVHEKSLGVTDNQKAEKPLPMVEVLSKTELNPVVILYECRTVTDSSKYIVAVNMEGGIAIVKMD